MINEVLDAQLVLVINTQLIAQMSISITICLYCFTRLLNATPPFLQQNNFIVSTLEMSSEFLTRCCPIQVGSDDMIDDPVLRVDIVNQKIEHAWPDCFINTTRCQILIDCTKKHFTHRLTIPLRQCLDDFLEHTIWIAR